jgi:hypothetical protein
VYAVLAWGAATASAMAVVWTGLDAVLPTAAEGPHVATVAAWPVQDAGSDGRIGSAGAATAVPTTAAVTAGSTATAAATGASGPSPSAPRQSPSTPRASLSPTASHSPGAPASGTASGDQRRYSTVGGTAVLHLYAGSASLDAAIPADGYSAKSWEGTDFLEVEFTPADGGTVYEVIATWNGTSPQVNTYAVGG